MKLNEKIIYCRKKAGYSQETLAEKLSVSRQAVSKWETGESQPELSKLAALATLFGVTADWLISEEEPESESASKAAPAAPATSWVDSVPGVIGKLIRKYGWIFGVYLAVTGALMSAIGAIARWVSIQMQRSTNDTIDSMLDAFNGMAGNSPLYPSVGDSFTDGMQSAMAGASEFNPVATVGTVIIVIGAVFCIGGIVLAVVLRKHSKKSD